MVGIGDGHRSFAVWTDAEPGAVVGVGDGNRLGVGDDLPGGRNDRGAGCVAGTVEVARRFMGWWG
jgi:hypothetical protein